MKNSELHHVLSTAAKRLRMRQVARSASLCAACGSVASHADVLRALSRNHSSPA